MLEPCGRWWDAVRVPSRIGRGVLARLGDESGAVIEDGFGSAMYWLVAPGTADAWTLRFVQILSTASYVGVPPASRTHGHGVRWIVPLEPNRYLTAPEALHAALAAEIETQTDPRRSAGA